MLYEPKLIYELLRNKLGFDGHFVSDCGAIHDIFRRIVLRLTFQRLLPWLSKLAVT